LIKYIRNNENEKSVGVEHDDYWLQKPFFYLAGDLLLSEAG
jgi:hypothetical protein